MLAAAGYDETGIVVTHAKVADRIIAEHQPNVVVAMGGDAFNSVYNTENPLGRHRGEILRVHGNGPKLVPTFDPNFVYKAWQNQETITYDLRKALATSDTKKMPLRMGKDYTVITSIEQAREAAAYLKKAKRMSYDIETEGFDLFEHDEILCVQFSTRKGEGIVFPLRGQWSMHETDTYSQWQLDNGFWRFIEDDDGNVTKLLCKNEENKPVPMNPAFPAGSVVCNNPTIHDQPKKPKGHFCRGTLTNVWGGKFVAYQGPGRMNGKFVPEEYIIIRDLLEDIFESDAVKVAHNGKFDCHGLEYQLGIIVRRFLIDTMLAYHQFHEERPHNLEFVRSRYSTMPKYDNELKSYVAKGKGGSFATVPNDILWYYGAADADLELRLVEPLLKEIMTDNPDNGMWLFENVDMPFNRALVQIENNGMLIDTKRFDVLVGVYNDALKEFGRRMEVQCKEHGLSDLGVWNNANTLRPWLFETDYEWITEPAKYKKCKECNSDTRVDTSGACFPCDGTGKILTKNEVTRPMRGIGMPAWGVPVTDNDELKTDKKAFTALLAWCAEDVVYTLSTVKGTAVRRPTKKPLSDRELKTRAWKREILNTILRYKQSIQARNLFLEGNPDKKSDGAQAMLKHIRSDGRVHCTYMQLTTTARLSATAPNLQNISNEDDVDGYFYGSGIRTMFTAPEGYRFVEVDYSSQEMRILAYLADERNLMDVFTVCQTCGEDFKPTADNPERPFEFKIHRAMTGHKAQDLHTGTAAKVFAVEYDKVTKQQRTFAKRINFGLNYGQGSRGLAEVLGISLAEAQEVIDDYMAAFPGIRLFQATKKNNVYRGRKIPNGFGRWKHNFGVKEMKNYLSQREYEKVVSSLYRSSVNYPVQSTPADISANVVIALADVWGVEREDWRSVEAHAIAFDLMGFNPATRLRDLGVKMVNLVHDSFQFEIPEENVEEAVDIITRVAEGLPFEQLGWFLPVDVSVGSFWGQHEEWRTEHE
jgi:DNA polymerase I-like protein with 3'-5' exonuclease and polymerase domains